MIGFRSLFLSSATSPGDPPESGISGSPLPTVGGSGILLLPTATPVVGTGFDSTVSNVMDMFGTWSISNANSIQTHIFTFEAMN